MPHFPSVRKKLRLPSLGRPAVDRVKRFFFPVFWGTRDPELVTQHMKAVTEHVEARVPFRGQFFHVGQKQFHVRR